VRCHIEPLPRGTGREIVSRVPEREPPIPQQMIDAALDGLDEGAHTGPSGYPMEDLRIELLDIDFREQSQPQIGLKVAAAEALRQAIAKASPIELEPIMDVDVLVPDEFLGAVIGDLRSRKAVVQEIGQSGDVRTIQARAPLRQMFGYSTGLRSLTKGKANFGMTFHAYDNLASGVTG
jgi:elongation factor G